MAIITLTTDLGLIDYYVASVKGAILSELPDSNIIDITHEIPSFDLQKTAFVIKNCYKDFPKGSIHIIGVNSETNIDIPHIYYSYPYYDFRLNVSFLKREAYLNYSRTLCYEYHSTE